MEDDLISSLTRQVKDEVIENYLTERCIVGFQMEDVQKRGEEAGLLAVKTGRRLSRMAYLMVSPNMQQRLMHILHVPEGSFWASCIQGKFARDTRFIQVRALTDKGKFKKLVLEANNRLYQWMDDYRKTYEDLAAECRGVNLNIDKFQKNFDLLTILSFLKNLDTTTLERKQFLGENFTAQELSSIDEKLFLHHVSIEKLNIPPPLTLPKREVVEYSLNESAGEIYRTHQGKVKRLME
ncbi:MAG: hypothetical protein HGB17_12940 [Syntrophobacteraceae bacterium]|nr:hypothetical protein [Syntrophobacteraceae bacterium]